jgi:Predicted thioesterase involved in non-ribosomal peptide biosynthesis
MNESKDLEKKIQLFCVPFAGGNRAVFRNLSLQLNDEVDAVLLEYPGHGVRSKEAFCTTIEELKEDVKKQININRKENIPYSILGYSMGSIVTYELVSDLWNAENGSEVPTHVFLCANEALSNYNPRINLSEMTKDEIQKKLISMGGIDERILKDQRFSRIFLRPVEADYQVLEKYSFNKDRRNPKLDCSIFYSENDTSFDQVEDWRNLFDGSVDFYELGENHFFIREHSEEMANVINRVLLNI